MTTRLAALTDSLMETLLPGLILHYDKCIYWNNNSGSQFKENKICWTFQEMLWTRFQCASQLFNRACCTITIVDMFPCVGRTSIIIFFFFYNLGVCEGPVIFQINWTQLQFLLSNRQNTRPRVRSDC